MWLIILWLVGVPKLLYNFILTLALLVLFVCYKVFGSSWRRQSWQSQQHQHQYQCIASGELQERLERHHKLLVTGGELLRDKIKLGLARGTRAMRLAVQRGRASVSENGREREFGANAGAWCHQQRRANNQNDRANHTNNNQSGTNERAAARLHLASLALFACGALLAAGCCLPLAREVHGLEQDAEILRPVASMAKAVIKTVTLGVPLEIQFDPTGVAKNFAYFTWRTGFPVSMPSGFVGKAQDFYNRVKARVDAADVADVERKALASLKRDLDDIVDGIVEEVRQSPRGLYTDYLQTRVNGVPLEDACVAVGTQLKAYGVDLTNYRNIAGMVLGIPVMPTVASAVMNVRNLASLDAMRNITTVFHPVSLARLPGSALGTLDNLRQQMPVQNMVQAPLSLLASGQRLLPGARQLAPVDTAAPMELRQQQQQPVALV